MLCCIAFNIYTNNMNPDQTAPKGEDWSEHMGESSTFPKSWTLENQNFKLAVCLQNIKNSKFYGQIPLD